jgi:hypothetical protein
MKNVTINGNNTKNQETPLCPALHNMLRTHVQNNIHNALIIIINNVFGTREL